MMEIVEYSSEMGESKYPEGFGELIKDLTVEDQVNFFRTTQGSSYAKTNRTERTLA